MLEGLRKGENVIVHCGRGISRSATVVIAALMVKDGLSYRDARVSRVIFYMFMLCMFTVCCDYRFSLVAAKRACIYPNVGFQLQLCLFEKLDKDFDEVRITHVYHLMLDIGRRRPSKRRLPRRSGARRVHSKNFRKCGRTHG